MRYLSLVATLLFLCSSVKAAPASDSLRTTKPPVRRNVVSWNATNYAIWGSGNIILGYERVVAPYRTLGISLGVREYPELIRREGSDVLPKKHEGSGGYTFATEYRFYWKSRNTKKAPDGLYVGPYYVFNYYRTKDTFRLTSNSAVELTTECKLAVHNIGAELGYQFMIRDRFAIDLILLGPSYCIFTGSLNLTANAPVDDPTWQAIRDRIEDSFPRMTAFTDKLKLERNKRTTFNSIGFRYLLKLGFAF